MLIQILLKTVLRRKILAAFAHPEKRSPGHQRRQQHKYRKPLGQQPAAFSGLFHQDPADHRINLSAPAKSRQSPEAAEYQIHISSQGKRQSRIIPEGHIQNLFTEKAAGEFKHSPHYVTFQKNQSGAAFHISLQKQSKEHCPKSPDGTDRKKQIAAPAAVFPKHKTTPDRL